METIVSQKKALYNVKIIGFTVFAVLFIGTSVYYSLAHYNNYRSHQAVYYLIALSLALLAIGIYKLVKGIVDQVIVSPDDVKISFMLKSKKINFKHTDVKAIYDLGGHDGGQGLMFNYKVQELELNDGTFVEFTDSQFTNYDELKAKLWEYRLLAYEAQRAKDAGNS